MKTPEMVHGKRTTYVKGCRCQECRRANREYSAEREDRARAVAALVKREAKPVPQLWTPAGGQQTVRVYRRACLGLEGTGCPRRSHLRKDSKGDLCVACRGRVLSQAQTHGIEKARAHFMALLASGMGLRTVADIAQVSPSTLRELKRGTKTWISPEVEAAILAVTPGVLNDASLVPAEPSWRRISDIIDAGYTLHEIAQMLGQHGPGLQLRVDRVTAKNALKIERLHRRVLEEEAQELPLVTSCENCGLAHDKASRVRTLERMLPASLKDITDAYPCLWPMEFRFGKGDCAPRHLYRDLHELGAVSKAGLWLVEH